MPRREDQFSGIAKPGCDRLPDVYEVAGDIAKEAGERAAKMGLADLATEGAALEGMADPDVVRTYLAKCVATCQASGKQKAFYSSPEAAKILGVEVAKVRHWCETGELKASDGAKKVGGKVRWKISQAALDEFMRARQNTTPALAAPAKQRREYVRMF